MTTDQEMQQLADQATDGPWTIAAPEAPSYAEHPQNECRCGNPDDDEFRFHHNDPDGGHWHQQIDPHSIYAGNEKTAIAGNYDYEAGGIIKAADTQFIAACREWVPDALKRLEAARELQAKIARHAQQDREEGLPATALLTQIANDLNRALEGK